MTLDQVNQLDPGGFVTALGGIFEHSPWVAEAAWPQRPFESVDALHQAMVTAVQGANEDRQLQLLQAHPELAGRQARRSELTTDSESEQRSAGLDRLTGEQMTELDTLNADYRERFGFPFIIAVRQHTLESLLARWRQRLKHSPQTERDEALAQVAQIARIRLAALLEAEA